MPSVSICIPSYNHARFLTESLRSASAQTYTDLEIVVLDNDSQDDTAAVVEYAAARDPRIRYIRHPRNIGLTGNLSACIQCASGIYVKLLCADDSLEPECVATMVKAFEDHPSVSLVGCARLVTDADLRPLRVAGMRKALVVTPGEEMLSECFFFGNRIGEPTAVMFKRSDSTRGFNANYRLLVDLEMWFDLLSKGDFVALPHPLCRIRTHAAQATNLLEESGGTIADRVRIYREFGERAARTGTRFRKLIWDFRMAYTTARAETYGHGIRPDPRLVTFFPRVFRLITYPAVRVMTNFGLKRFWRTA